MCFLDRLNDFNPGYINLSIDGQTEMKFLIPMTSGPGVITTALVDHLVLTHNKFIRLCRKLFEDSLNK